jgi:molybdopterin-containing oxidoreductase family iron-sulfur binding subunit
MEAYANDRLGYRDVRGPGITSFTWSVCRDCPNHCSLAVRKVDKIPVGLRGAAWHPASRGGLCVAGQSQMQALFDPDRLEKPLQRADAGEPARTVEWSEALDLLHSKLETLIGAGAGDRIAVVEGRTPSLGTLLLESWVQSIPGARYIPLRVENALDGLARAFLGGAPGGRLRLDLAHSGTLLLVGSELLEVDGSPVTQMRTHGDRRADPLHDHAPTIYIGPRRGLTAIKSDYWIPCQAGRERSILLAIAEALSREHPQRASIFLEYGRWIPEAQDEVEFARRYSLENIARQQGLEAAKLEVVVRALQRFGPAVSLPGPGILRRLHGGTDARAVLALNLWTGGFAEAGGLSWGHDPLVTAAMRAGFRTPQEHDPAGLSDILQPLLEIKRSPVDLLICVEANLVHELPGRDQIERALSHVPFVVSFSAHEDETSRVSHVTLPTLLDVESWDLPASAWGFPEPAMQVQTPAVIPVVEAKSVEQVILNLASRGGSGPTFSPPTGGVKNVVEAVVQSLVENGQGELVGPDGRRPVSALSVSSTVKGMMSGEIIWTDVSRPGPRASRPTPEVAKPLSPMADLAPDQLWLTSFDGSALQRGRVLNRPMMMEMAGLQHGLAWESWVEIHPRDANPRHIVTGDRVIIRGPRAEVTAKAVVTRAIHPGTVSTPVGFGHRALGEVARGKGSNPLELPYAALDGETGTPVWGPIPVFVVKG